MKAISIPMDELLRGMMADHAAPRAERPNDIKARIVLDGLKHWHAAQPFKVGDLVTPRQGGLWKPSLGVCCVTQLLDEGFYIDQANSQRVTRWNMFIIEATSNGYCAELAVHSRDFEAYTGPVAGDAA